METADGVCSPECFGLAADGCEIAMEFFKQQLEVLAEMIGLVGIIEKENIEPSLQTAAGRTACPDLVLYVCTMYVADI